MSGAELSIGEAPAMGPGAKHYRLECAHGRTSVVLLPGSSALGDLIALQMLVVRHGGENGCRCGSLLRP